jgi:uncharacterized protein
MKQNPFLISGYSSPEFFCDREAETARVIEAIRNQRHLTIISPRRMGKTGVIKHSFYQLRGKKSVTPVYLDILTTTSLVEFTELFGRSVLSTLAGSESLFKKVSRVLSSLRLKLSIDPLTGEPSVTFSITDRENAIESLGTIFRYISTRKSHFVIAIDEFQQIVRYDEGSTEAIIRSHLQNTPNISFIFSGSRQHVLSEIFTNPARPLFNTTEIIDLTTIESSLYKNFIAEKFSSANKKITASALDYIEKLTGMHTFYVQYLCNRLYGRFKSVDSDNVKGLLVQILAENESVYANYLSLLTPTQIRVIKSVALAGGVTTPTSAEFISAYNLGAPSTVSQAIKSLTDKQFLYHDGEKYKLTDVFFSWWIYYR